MKEINLSIKNGILNNGVIDDLSDEQKCILTSLNKIFQNLEIKTFGNINIVLNFTVNDDEFDLVSIFSDLDKKTYYLLFLEVKNFSSLEGFRSIIKDKYRKGLQKFTSKLTNFQKMILNRYGSIVDHWNIKIFGMFYAINSGKSFPFFEIYNGKKIDYSLTKFRELMNYFFAFQKTQNLNVIKALNDILSKPNDVSKFCNYLVNGSWKIDLEGRDIWKINDKSKRIVIFDGAEGSGKTSLAFNVYASKLEIQENAILWLICPSFCKEINHFLKTNYKNFIYDRRPLFHFDDVKARISQFSDKKEITIIIDEAQRLKEDQLKFLNESLKNKLVSKLILFYDQNQRIAKADFDSIEKIKNSFEKSGENIDFVELKTNHRTGNLDEIKYYLYLKHNVKKNRVNKLPKCSFKLCSSFDEFLNLFKLDEPKTKIMTAPQFSDYFGIDKWLTDKGINPSINLKNRDWFVTNKEKKNYYFSPYELSSREIDECFLFLGENIKFDKDKKKITSTTKKLNQMLSSQLNTLISRATQKLVVFAVDEDLKDAILSRSRLEKK